MKSNPLSYSGNAAQRIKGLKKRLGHYEEAVGTYIGLVEEGGYENIALSIRGEETVLILPEEELSYVKEVLSSVKVGGKVGILRLPDVNPHLRVRVLSDFNEGGAQ